MAAAERCCPFELPVRVLTDSGSIAHKNLQSLCKELSSEISSLNRHFKTEKKENCVYISSFSVQKDTLIIRFSVENLKDLEKFRKLSRKGWISNTFKDYLWFNNIDIRAGLKLPTKLCVHLEMDETTYSSAKSVFEADTNVDTKYIGVKQM